MHKIIFLLNVIALFCIPECNAQSNPWELKKDENGIKVYVRANKESSFDSFKAFTNIPDCSLNDALKAIVDIKDYEEWFPDCANPKVLEQISEYHDIHYIETISPWPVENRCGVYEQTTTLSKNDTKAEIVFEALADYPIEVDDMVRIKKARGKWTLEQGENNALTITYEFNGDPGGNVPAWLANAFVVKHPFESLGNFKKLMEK